MGYSCSPIWCNLYLAWFELDYIRKLNRLGKGEMIKAFYSSSRYMDDLAFINNPFAIQCLNHSRTVDNDDEFCIYPLNIIQIKPTFDTYSTTYLNIEVKLCPSFGGEFTTSTSWKRDKLPCQNVSFIHERSNRPRNMAYKVCVSQVMPILYNASQVNLALIDLTKLCNAFIRNGFNKSHIQRNILYFLERNNFPGIKFQIEDLILAFGRE